MGKILYHGGSERASRECSTSWGVSVLEVLEAELYKILGALGVTAAKRFFVHC